MELADTNDLDEGGRCTTTGYVRADDHQHHRGHVLRGDLGTGISPSNRGWLALLGLLGYATTCVLRRRKA